MLIENAKQRNARKEEFDEIVEQLKAFNYIV
jgi:hypothetical protein